MKALPYKFQIFDQWIIVSIEDFPYEDSHNDGFAGFASYRTNTIRIRPNINYHIMEAAFWHELTHFVLYYSGSALSKTEEYPHQSEGFVELTAQLFKQAVNSFQFYEQNEVHL